MAVERIERLKVTNFQSVKDAEIDVGGFTVIVGPSNSGKSALVRALRAVARNVNSPAAVRAGAKVFSVAVEAGDSRVSIERGKSSSTYRVGRYSDGAEEVYSKSGRSVPEDVQQALALPVSDGPDLTFASQLDPPFLLAETGSTVAKVLGDLTNVSRLHTASREANRRKTEHARLAKLRRDDAAAVRRQLNDQYGTLQQEAQGLRELREAVDEVRDQAKATETLAGLLEEHSTITAAERDLQGKLDRIPEADVAQIVLDAQRAVYELREFEALVSEFIDAEQAEKKAESEIDSSSAEESEAEQEYAALLKEAGVCPMCGSAT